MSDPTPAPDEVPDVTTTADPPAEAPVEVPTDPPVPVCSACGHAIVGHVDGRGFCLIQLGEYGGGGPCGCTQVAA